MEFVPVVPAPNNDLGPISKPSNHQIHSKPEYQYKTSTVQASAAKPEMRHPRCVALAAAPIGHRRPPPMARATARGGGSGLAAPIVRRSCHRRRERWPSLGWSPSGPSELSGKHATVIPVDVNRMTTRSPSATMSSTRSVQSGNDVRCCRTCSLMPSTPRHSGPMMKWQTNSGEYN